MLCFNMDLKIRFHFEFGDTQRTKVGCKSCEKNFTLNESLMYHIIEVHGKQWKHFKEAFEDEAEGCDDEQVKTRLGKEFELLGFCFNITNINILNFILLYFLDLLDIENYCRYVIRFTYDQVSVNVYNLRTNSEKNISQQKNLVFNVFMVFVRVKPIVIINYGNIFTIVVVDFLIKWLNLEKYP